MVVSLGSLPRAVTALALLPVLAVFSSRSTSGLASAPGLSRCTTRSGAAGRAPGALGAVTAGVVAAVDAPPAEDSAQAPSAIASSPAQMAGLNIAGLEINVKRHPSPCQPIDSRIP